MYDGVVRNGNGDLRRFRKRAEREIMERGCFVTLANSEKELAMIRGQFSGYNVAVTMPEIDGNSTYHIVITPKSRLEDIPYFVTDGGRL